MSELGRKPKHNTDLFRFGGVTGELIYMFPDSDDLGVEITFQRGQRVRRVLRIPDGRCGHTKHLGTGVRRGLEIFAHDPVICVVLAGVMAFVEDDK